MADVKIDIPGIGEVTAENAASEATLREILKALGGRKMGPNTGSDSGPYKDTEKAVEGMGDAAKQAGEEVKTFGEKVGGAISGAFNLLTSAIGATIGSVVGLGTELIAGGNRLTDFAQYLPIPGLTMLTGLLDNQIDQFRELSSVGASFGNNMFEITRIAGEAAIPQRDFAELLTTQSDALRLFGNSVNSGARNFASMSKEMRQGGIGSRLMAMGFTTQELNENLISYNEMMLVSGRRRYMTDQELVEGAQAYSMELDKISKLTGKSRKQLEEEMKQKNLDIRRQMAIAKYGEEYALRLQQAAAVSPQFEAALLDMADGVANDPLTRQLMAQSETFRTQVGRINTMTAEEFNNFTNTVGQEGMAFANRMGEAGVQASVANGTAVGEFLGVVGQLQRTRQTVDGLTADEQRARDALTEKLGNFAEIVNDIRGQVQVALLDSGIFQDIKEGIANMIPDMETAQEYYRQATEVFKTNILPAIERIWNWLKNDGLNMAMDAFQGLRDMWNEYYPQIQEWFNKLFTEEGRTELWNTFKEKTMQWITDWWAGLSSEDVLAGIVAGLAAIVLGPLGLIGGAIVSGLVATFGWENIKQFFDDAFESVKTFAGDTVTELWNDVKSWLSGLWASMFSSETSSRFNIMGFIGEKLRSLLDWFSGIFSIDIGGLVGEYIPNWAKRFLPDSWFAGPQETASQTPAPSASEVEQAQAEENPETTTTPAASPSVRTATNATSMTDTQMASLNTNMSTLVELMRTQNRLLRQMDGNLVG